jgi:AcrR family transcriptional regulator
LSISEYFFIMPKTLAGMWEMRPGTEPQLDRGSRRRLRTRARLIDAARRIIAERGGIDAVPIAEITDAADVAIGSFYNHFPSRAALLEAVVSETLEAHGQRLDAMAEEIADVAEFCAAGMRLTMRMVEADPIWGGFMVQTGIYLPELSLILGRRLVRTLLHGMHSGRFTVANEATTLAVVTGAVFGAMHARRAQESPGSFPDLFPDPLPEDADCLVAEQLLQLLGLPREEAAEIARRPLPRSWEQLRPATDPNARVVSLGTARKTP